MSDRPSVWVIVVIALSCFVPPSVGMVMLGERVDQFKAEVIKLKQELTEVQKRDRRCLMHAVELP